MKLFPVHEKNDNGFTLIELVIAMALGLVILTAIYSVSIITKKTYSVQDQIVMMQQNARASMDMMTREIKMAGYDPIAGVANSRIIGAQTNSIRFTLDITSTYGEDRPDGDTDDPNEDVTYALYTPADGIQKLGRAIHGGTPQPIAEHIQSLQFIYRDSGGSQMTTPVATPSNIRSIEITLVARTPEPDPKYTHPSFGDHYRRYTLTSTVIPRNLK
jgi:type IV pilus assembly protein PilW